MKEIKEIKKGKSQRRETIKVQCMHDRPTGGKQYKECKGEQKIDQKKSREGGAVGGGQ